MRVPLPPHTCFEVALRGDRPPLMRLLTGYAISFNRRQYFDQVLQKMAVLFHLEPDYIVGKGRQADRVKARDLLCYGCAVELEMTIAELSRRLNLTLAAVSHTFRRGEKRAKEMGWGLGQ